MLSRRTFLKSVGIAAALGAGFGAGKLFSLSGNKTFALHGFIPADEKYAADVFSAFIKKIRSNSTPIIYAEQDLKRMIEKVYPAAVNGKYGLSSKETISIRMNKLNTEVNGDILLSDASAAVFNPDEDFTSSFIWLRKSLKNTKAQYLISIEYKENDLFSSLFKANDKIVVIENEKGIVDKVDINKSYKNILIDGPQGNTALQISDGLAHVHKSTCRHSICTKAGFISEIGSIIACAPNKVLIKIEKA
jgi:hypothetical protein